MSLFTKVGPSDEAEVFAVDDDCWCSGSMDDVGGRGHILDEPVWLWGTGACGCGGKESSC